MIRKELLTHQDPKSPVSEIFRTLRTNIQFMNTDNKLKSLLITSTFPEEGKSWVTSNLAVTFAQAGKKVILVDADMRKGRQYKIFGVLPKPGLSNYLSNMDADNMETTDVNVTNYIQQSDIENLHILVAGNVPPNPSELLVSSRMINLLQELKSMCDLVIIDGTPCDLVTDSIILSRMVDSTIIVTAQKETKRDNLVRIVKNIQNVGGKIAGVVLNKVDISTKKYNQSYYYGSIAGEGMKGNKSNKIVKVNNMGSKREREKKNQEEREKVDKMLEDLYNAHEKEKRKKQFTYNVNDKRADITKRKKSNNQNGIKYNNSQRSLNIDEKENIKLSSKESNVNLEKTKDILKQVSDYLESEKRK